MAWLIKSELRFVEAGGGKHTDGSRHHTGLIGENVAKHILCQNHVKLTRIFHQLHGAVIYQHMGQFHFWIIFGHFLHYASPQTGGIQHVGFIHAGHFLSSLHGDVEGPFRNSADLIFIVSQGVNRFSYAIFLYGFTFTEIQAPCQFPHDHHIKPVADDLVPQRAGVFQFLIQVCRPQVGKQIQRLADSQKSCLRTFGRLQAVPGRCGGVSADGSHQHRIRCLCLFDGLLRQRNAMGVDGSPSQQQRRICKFMVVFLTDFIQNLFRFPDDLRSDSVSRYQCNLIIHDIFLPKQP